MRVSSYRLPSCWVMCWAVAITFSRSSSAGVALPQLDLSDEMAKAAITLPSGTPINAAKSVVPSIKGLAADR